MSRTHLRGAVAAAAAALFASSAPALTIDDFEVGDFSVSDDQSASGPTFGEQSGLPTSSVVGGVRLLRSIVYNQTIGPASATASLATSGGDDSAALSVLGANALGDFAFIYDGVAGGSLDGRLGTLNIDLSPFQSIDVEAAGATGSATLRLTLWSSAPLPESSSAIPLVAGTNSFSLADFTVIDLTDIHSVRLEVFQVALFDTPTLSNIAAVPEPGTALLLVAGLLGLSARRRLALRR